MTTCRRCKKILHDIVPTDTHGLCKTCNVFIRNHPQVILAVQALDTAIDVVLKGTSAYSATHAQAGG